MVRDYFFNFLFLQTDGSAAHFSISSYGSVTYPLQPAASDVSVGKRKRKYGCTITSLIQHSDKIYIIKYPFVIHSTLDEICIAVLLTSGRVRMSTVKRVVTEKSS
jgi:hypothetical protein